MLSNDPERRCGGFLEPGRLAPGGIRQSAEGAGPVATFSDPLPGPWKQRLGQTWGQPSTQGWHVLGAQTCPRFLPSALSQALGSFFAAPRRHGSSGGCTPQAHPTRHQHPHRSAARRPSALGPSSQEPGTNHLSSSPGHHSCLSLSLFCSLPSSPSDASRFAPSEQEPFISTVLYSAP